MTEKLKSIAAVASLFSALFLIAAAPFILIGYQNRVIMGRTTSLAICQVAPDDENTHKDPHEYSLWERIMLAKDSVILYSVTQNDTDGILDILDVQLGRLYEYGAVPLPCLPDDGELLSLNVIKNTYLRSANEKSDVPQEQTITVWDISAEYDAYGIYACIDTDTCAVCDITIVSKALPLTYQHDGEGDPFISYLRSISPAPTNAPEFSSGGYRGDRVLRLYVTSKDPGTDKVTNYRFGKYAVNVNTGELSKTK